MAPDFHGAVFPDVKDKLSAPYPPGQVVNFECLDGAEIAVSAVRFVLSAECLV